MKNEWNKWNNHFYEMKGDVGMSVHEKERKQEDAYTKIQTHRRCARTPSVRFSLAVHSYGRSWGSAPADTERRHLRVRAL